MITLIVIGAGAVVGIVLFITILKMNSKIAKKEQENKHLRESARNARKAAKRKAKRATDNIDVVDEQLREFQRADE